MYCEKCGRELRDDSTFCDGCGAKQHHAAFCIHCGKQLIAGAKFCDGCGGAQSVKEVEEPPVMVVEPVAPATNELPEQPKVKKKRKVAKWLIPVVAAVVVLAVAAAVVIPIIFPPMVTVNVLTGIKVTSSLHEYEEEIFYDDFGNPDVDLGLVYHPVIHSLWSYSPQLMEFDKHGNLLTGHMGEVPFEYDYDYDENDRIESCTVRWADGEKFVGWEFSYDRKGNLICALRDRDGISAIVRADFSYDDKDRLLQEYFFIASSADEEVRTYVYTVQAYEYEYDQDGNLSSVSYAEGSDIDDINEEIDDLDLDFQEVIRFGYDDEGRAEEVEYRDYQVDSGKNSWESLRFEYDRKGNLKAKDFSDLYEYNDFPLRNTYEYDSSGCLVRMECYQGDMTEPERVIEFEYEEVKMTKAAAQRYENWEKLMNLDCDSPCFQTRLDAFFVEHPGNGYYRRLFFYYLIPNPLW